MTPNGTAGRAFSRVLRVRGTTAQSCVRRLDAVWAWPLLCGGKSASRLSRSTLRVQSSTNPRTSWRSGGRSSSRRTHGLKKQGDPDAREVRRLQAKLGEVMMRLELAEDLLEKRATGRSCESAGDESAIEPDNGTSISVDDGVSRHAFRNELAWLGIAHSPSFVGEPQCNGVMERFIRTLKERSTRRE
jgi:transposase InsO family protein